MTETDERLRNILGRDSPQDLADLMDDGVPKTDILIAAMGMEKFPIKTMDSLRKLLGPEWMVNIPQKIWEKSNRKQIFGWWVSDNSQQTLQAVRLFLDYHIWMFQNQIILDPGSRLVQPPMEFVSEILEDLSVACHGIVSITEILGNNKQSKSGLADLGLLALFNPDVNWPRRFGVTAADILACVMDQAPVRFMAFGHGFNGLLIEKWCQAKQDNQTAWDQFVDKYRTDIREAGDWLDTWLPEREYEASPLQKWSKIYSNDEVGPLGHRFLSKCLVQTPSEDQIKFSQQVFDDLLGRGKGKLPNHLIYTCLGNIVDRLNENASPLICIPHYPSKLGLDIYSDPVNSVDKAAKDPSLVSELMELLKDDAEQIYIGNIDCSNFLDWVKKVSGWETWRDNKGRNLFYRWHEERKQIEAPQGVSFRDIIQPVVDTYPHWLWEPDYSGKSCIDGLMGGNDLRSDIKRQLLGHFSGKTSEEQTNTNKPKI